MLKYQSTEFYKPLYKASKIYGLVGSLIGKNREVKGGRRWEEKGKEQLSQRETNLVRQCRAQF